MKRREFINVLGGAAVAWPLKARAQQPAMPVIGFLNGGSPEGYAPMVAAFRKGLSETGYADGQNMAIEYRWANNRNRSATGIGGRSGPRPGRRHRYSGQHAGGIGGQSRDHDHPDCLRGRHRPSPGGSRLQLQSTGRQHHRCGRHELELGPKRLGLLHDLLPGAVRFAVLVNPKNPDVVQPFIKDVQAAGATIGRQIEVLAASTNRDIDTAFASLVQKRADALLVAPETLFSNRRVQLVTLAAHHRVPAIYPWREPVEIGGLMSYATSIADVFRLVGIYTGRVLKGEKPADLPVLRASKFEFVINLQTAKALGLDVPPTLLVRADEVIE